MSWSLKLSLFCMNCHFCIFPSVGLNYYLYQFMRWIDLRDCLWWYHFGVPSRYGSIVELTPPKRFDGWSSSKADVGRKDRESKRNRCDFMDRRYVNNTGWKPDCTGQNYDPHSTLRESSLQPARTPLSSLESWTGGKRRPLVCDQDRLRTRIQWWKPYV